MVAGPGWYPVALSAWLDPGTSCGTRLFGREFVVWRAASGEAHVWEDRCPHRGMRLSFGFVRGDRLACLYHGWQYDGSGRCRSVPAHPQLDVPASIHAATYAVAERSGLVWAYSEPGDAPDAPADRSGLVPVRSIYVDCPLPLVAGHLGGDLVKVAGGSVLAALQPLDRSLTGIHLLVVEGVAPLDVARWAEALRHSLEAEVTA